MSTSLVDLLTPVSRDRQRVYGVVTGVVTNNQDPDKLGRVRVNFPWLSDEDESWWARVAAPMAGDQRGLYLLPEVDDEVLVVFEHGDVRFPYVIGALWSENAPPPETNEEGSNDHRVLKSRSGHVIRLDDTDGDEKIEIVDKDEKNSIVVSTANGTITIAGDSDIEIKSANGKLKLSANGIEITSQAGVSIEASADLNVKASGQLNAKGSTVNIN
jgi:uncharacterized protein involved in type VI secretion and phage assembly